MISLFFSRFELDRCLLLYIFLRSTKFNNSWAITLIVGIGNLGLRLEADQQMPTSNVQIKIWSLVSTIYISLLTLQRYHCVTTVCNFTHYINQQKIKILKFDKDINLYVSFVWTWAQPSITSDSQIVISIST